MSVRCDRTVYEKPHMRETLTKTMGIGALWSVIGQSGNKIIGIMTMLIILRSLSVYEYGVIELVMSIPALLSMFSMPGLSTVVIADMGRARSEGNYVEMKRLFVKFFRLVFLFSLIPCVAVLAVPSLLLPWYDVEVQNMIRLVALIFPVTAFSVGGSILFRVFLKFDWATWGSMAYEIVKLVAIALLFFVFFEPSPLYVIIANVCADWCAVLMMSPFSLRLYRSFSGAGRVPWGNMFEPLKDHGKWGVLSAYLASFSQSLRPWLIKVTIGTEAVGLFAAAQGLIQHTFSLLPLAALIQPVLPQYIERRELFLKVWHKMLKYQLITSGCLALLGVFVFPYFIAVLFPKYIESIALYRVMLLVFVAYAFTPVIAGTFNALRAQRSVFFALVVRTILTLVLLPVLALTFGLWGVALEFIVTSTVYQLERYRRLKQVLPELRLSLREFTTFDQHDRMLLEKVAARIPILKRWGK